MSNRAVVTITGHADRERVATWAKNVELGTIVEFRKKTRSHEQNAKLHAMLGEVAEQVVWYGRKLDATDWKHIFTASLRHADVVPGIDRGTVVPLGMRTSQMTIEEMGNLIELIYAFGADPAHPVTFKEPKEQNTETSDVPHASDAGSDTDLLPGEASTTEPGGSSESSSPAGSPGSEQSESDHEFDQVDWLRTFARVIVAAIGPDEAAVVDVSKGQFVQGLSEDTATRARTIINYARQACRGEIEADDAKEIIAGKARMESVKELANG
jgi:hypothetical protein